MGFDLKPNSENAAIVDTMGQSLNPGGNQTASEFLERHAPPPDPADSANTNTDGVARAAPTEKQQDDQPSTGKKKRLTAIDTARNAAHRTAKTPS